jgi:drug/metabolite transporter (DMT)-like permease
MERLLSLKPGDEGGRGVAWNALWGRRANRRLLLARSITGYLSIALFYYSLVTLPLQEAVVINYTAPLCAAAMAWWWLGEPFGRTDATGAAISFVGVLLLAHTHEVAPSEGLLDIYVRPSPSP